MNCVFSSNLQGCPRTNPKCGKAWQIRDPFFILPPLFLEDEDVSISTFVGECARERALRSSKIHHKVNEKRMLQPKDSGSLLPTVLASMTATAIFCWAWARNSAQKFEPLERRAAKYAAVHRHDERWDKEPLEEKLKRSCPRTGKVYLVVGAGFLGRRIVHHLLIRREKVRVFDIVPIDRAIPVDLRDKVEFFQGDITNLEAVQKACEGVDVVFHNAVFMCFHQRLKSQAEFCEKVNVTGTQIVVEACRLMNVKMLIFTSSAHATMGPRLPSLDMDERVPFATRNNAFNHYCWTKAEAEQTVRKACSSSLKTAAIRPCSGIFGWQDRNILDRVLKEQSFVSLGGDMLDMTFVGNVAFAHLLLEQKLATSHEADGDAFCISNFQPMDDAEFRSAVQCVFFEEIGPRGLSSYKKIPYFIWALAYFSEFLQSLSPKMDLGDFTLLTPAMLKVVDISYAFNCEHAIKVLGYQPLYTVHQGLEKSKAEFKAQKML